MTDKFHRIALLIDADNSSFQKIEAVIEAVAALGHIAVKRAYGNWRKDVLQTWKGKLMQLAIKAEQQFDYVPGKNATDMALVIDAMCLLQRGIYDAFAIASSDSDYTPLAIHLRESGVYVIGVGESKAPEAFRCSCDTFILLENLSEKTGVPAANAERNRDPLPDVHSMLRRAAYKLQNADGYVNACAAGSLIKRENPDFSAKIYGYRSIPKLIQAFPDRYEIKKYPGKGASTAIMYRCLSKDSQKADHRREAIVSYLKKNGTAKKAELAELLCLKRTRTGEIINGLMQEGVIAAEGNRQKRTYRLAGCYM